MSEHWEPKTDDELERDRVTLEAQARHYQHAMLDRVLIGNPDGPRSTRLHEAIERANAPVFEQARRWRDVDAFMAAQLEHHVDEWQRETVRRIFSDGFDARTAWIRPRSYGRRWTETVLPTGPEVDERVRADYSVRRLLDEVATFGLGYRIHREDWSWVRRPRVPQAWTDHLAEITGAG